MNKLNNKTIIFNMVNFYQIVVNLISIIIVNMQLNYDIYKNLGLPESFVMLKRYYYFNPVYVYVPLFSLNLSTVKTNQKL